MLSVSLQPFLDKHPFVFITMGKGVHPYGFSSVCIGGSVQVMPNIPHKNLAGLFSYDFGLRSQGIQPDQEPFIELPLCAFFEREAELAIPDAIERTHDKVVTEMSTLHPTLSREEYLSRVTELKKHIQRGDIYEVNFCMEFRAENVVLDPLALYLQLHTQTQAPYNAFFKWNDLYVISASPECFLEKRGSRVISRPIKGTSARFTDQDADRASKDALLQSEKERSENVMIVDLVRNDLNKVCKTGSVKVDELFGIYSYRTVHQMVSTVSGELRSSVGMDELIQATFPMGSMTGAPKHRAMQLIQEFEPMQRGVYSGAMGLIHANGDLDLNVVIRSIVYDAKNQRLSFSVGSAITHLCDAEAEYEECLLKAKVLREVLSQ